MPATVPEIVQECLRLITAAMFACRSGQYDKAKQALSVALLQAGDMPEEFRPDFRAAFGYGVLLLQSRQSPTSVTPEMRSQAGALLDQPGGCDSVELFQELMFELLTDLGEYRRAIPFGERSLAFAVEAKQFITVADRLWKIGRCYSRLGRLDHAAIAYTGSVRIFRKEPSDPRLPAVLLALGNAIRKSAPVEAEQLYSEAAALWEKKGQLESATPAWMNLGIVCSDQQRFEEAIGYYDRVRRVRESSPSTPPVRIGVLYNNLAGCYRKMARFAEAHQAIERSLQILAHPGTLGPDDRNSFALSLGTKGMILRDEGRDLESIEWFRQAYAELEKQPAPHFDYLIQELEHEAEALTRLNRTDEARAVEEKIQLVRKAASEIPSMRHTDDGPVKLSEGALLIEVEGGLRSESTTSDIVKLGICLNEILQEQNLGDWQGYVRIPECATLIYYGPDSEAMYNALEPTLQSDPRFEGALVTIRQGTRRRDIAVPRRRVN